MELKKTKWMLYGAYGYTGKLVLEKAVAIGEKPVLAGRSESELRPLANKYNLEYKAFGLKNFDSIVSALGDIDTVLHCAGPFILTSDPMLRASVSTGTNYLDITGEIEVFENTFLYNNRAKEMKVALVSGCGFDVVPTDCMAKYVSEKLPDATHLELAFAGIGKPSAGTLKTMLDSLPKGGLVRTAGRLEYFPSGRGAKEIQYSHRKLWSMPIPWGDLETAFYSTKIPNITVFMAYPKSFIWITKWFSASLRYPLMWKPYRRFVQWLVGMFVSGPDEKARTRSRSYIYAKATNAKGNTAEAWLETKEAYEFTGYSALMILKEVREKKPAGAFTPSQLCGSDFVLKIDSTKRKDTL